MRQPVDPFIPVRRKPQGPAGPYGMRYIKKPQTGASLSPIPVDRQPAMPSAVTSQTQPSHPVAVQAPRRRPRAIDGFIRQASPAPRRPLPLNTLQGPREMAGQAAPRDFTAPAPTNQAAAPAKRRGLPFVLQLLLMVIVAFCAGLLIQTLVFGELTIAAYAVFALVRRIPSRNTFLLALIALCGVVLLLILHGGESGLSDNFAVYAFLLLVVGTISLGVEAQSGVN